MSIDGLQMEVYESLSNFIILKDESALVCDKSNGSIQVSSRKVLSKESAPKCLGVVYGVVGKLKIHPNGAWYLLLIRNVDYIAKLPDNSDVYRIKNVAFLPLVTGRLVHFELESCSVHNPNTGIFPIQDVGKPFIRVMQSTFKTYTSTKPKVTSYGREGPALDSEQIEREKFERRMQEEVLRLFQEDGGFYFSESGDLTTRQQVQHSETYRNQVKSGVPLWRRVDERFFWNKALLADVLQQVEVGACSQELVRPFLVPLMQGYVEMSPLLSMSSEGSEMMSKTPASSASRSTAASPTPGNQRAAADDSVSDSSSTVTPVASNVIENIGTTGESTDSSVTNNDGGPSLRMWIISRRCKYQAGTRYRRRGVDKNGFVANYVETEQIIRVNCEPNPHFISFCQLRGSIPVFWSQSGIKYKPPIRLERSEEDNRAAFEKHFNRDVDAFGHITTVSLVATSPERSEKKISDAYLKHLLLYPRNENITHVMFDFHDYCPGTNFHNVPLLLRGVEDILKEMNYCWADSSGLITEQKGIFRVNCMDCLDRTNVVQVLFALVMLETQLRRLGLMNPEKTLPTFFNQCVLHMWGNNGDAISTQYAGTIAMKGDYTRTKERTATGMMRDGISSMTRYYLRYREIRMQAAVDLILQYHDSPELLSMQRGSEDTSAMLAEKEENIKRFTEECRRLCIEEDEERVTECILIACDEREGEIRDMNTVALITTKHYYIIRTDKVFCLKIPIVACVKLEIGLQAAMFRTPQMCMRLHFHGPNAVPSSSSSPTHLQRVSAIPGLSPSRAPSTSPSHNLGAATASPSTSTYFLAFRHPNMRLFNNMLSPIRDEEDTVESLRAVAAYFCTAALSLNHNMLLEEKDGKLDRLRYRPPPPEYVVPSVTAEKIYAQLPSRSSLLRRRGSTTSSGSGNAAQVKAQTTSTTPIPPRNVPYMGFTWQVPKTSFFKDRFANLTKWPIDIGAKLNNLNRTFSRATESHTSTATVLPAQATETATTLGLPISTSGRKKSDPTAPEENSESEWEEEFIQQVVENDVADTDTDDEVDSRKHSRNDDMVVVEMRRKKVTPHFLPSSGEQQDNLLAVDLSSRTSSKALSDSELEALEEGNSTLACLSSHPQQQRRSSLDPETMAQVLTRPPTHKTLASVLSVEGPCHEIGLDLSKHQPKLDTITPPCPPLISISPAVEESPTQEASNLKSNGTTPTSTLKHSFSETAMFSSHYTAQEPGSLTAVREMTAAQQQLPQQQQMRFSSIIRLPEIAVANQRHAQRLQEKQQMQLIELENMRKVLLGGKNDLRMNVIIF